MERCRKKDILALIHTMMEANESVVKALPADPQKLNDVFIQCQDAAIQIGTQLESFGDKYTPIVNILEDYCEKVYQMSIVTSDGNACRKLSKKIRKQLTDLQNRIQYEMPEDRKEVVFLPYKASMWDSLESVWKAADEDENTDAYVIPIPYYDKNPDGSFREEHYEGDLYPDYVPITKYDEYDFEGRRPDMIYIHNPYDNNNYVTSVHPFFYSGNLKKFTDKLIYIPYFVLEEIDPENADAVEGIKHFCITQGVINADKVIVQSEDMKKIYVNVLTDFMKEHTGEDTRKYWEEKILGLGSPKLDKVISTRKEDIVVPEEWLKVIEKPDGSWKKIIFYNTSVQALLEHNEKMNAKIKDVLRVFKENQEEVALLWRPHPLIEATIKSVRVRLWEEYKEIVDTYRAEGWGIYDDTADLDRAIAVSDGYYGDGSSIVQLYQKTKKPIMIQDVSIIGKAFEIKSGKYKIAIGDAIESNNMIWFVPLHFRCLFSIDKVSKEIQSYEIPSTEPYSIESPFGSMKLIKDKIYFIPLCEKMLVCFNINKKEFKKIELDKSIIGDKKAIFMGVAEYKNCLFITGAEVPAIIRVNTENDSLDYIIDWEQKIKDLVFDYEDAYFRKQCIVLKNKLYVPFCNANAVLELNCDNLLSEIHVLGEQKQGYSGICFDGKRFWLSPRKNGDLVKWNSETGEKEYFALGIKENEGKLIYAGILCYKDWKVLLPFSGKDRVKYENNKIVILNGSYNFSQESDNNIIYYEAEQGVLTIIDKKTNHTSEIVIRIKSEDFNNYLIMQEYMQKSDYFIVEREEREIEQFVPLIQKENRPLSINSFKYGEIVYNRCKYLMS